MPFFIIALVVIVLVLIIANIRIIPQASEVVIERLGKFQKVWDAGLHVKVPFIDRMANRVILKEQILDTPPQSVITSDNVTMQIDAVVYYKVNNSELYTYGTARPVDALANLTTTTLRNIIGDMSLDQTLTSRDTVNSKMAAILDKETDPWGIKVIRVELRNIIPPPDIREAMEKQMRAERERRETLLQAEGHKQAAVTRAEGDKQAMILKAEGERDARIARAEGEAKAKILKQKAEAEALRLLKEARPDQATLELKRYDALVALANGRAAKLIVPTDVVEATKNHVLFSETTELGHFTQPVVEEPNVASKDDCCSHLLNDPQYRDLVGIQ